MKALDFTANGRARLSLAGRRRSQVTFEESKAESRRLPDELHLCLFNHFPKEPRPAEDRRALPLHAYA